MQLGVGITRDSRRASPRSLRALLYLLLFTVAHFAIAQEPLGPPLLSPEALNRVPQDFAGLPSVLDNDPFFSPLLWPVDPPQGYTGPSGILPREMQQDSHFVPMEDRWRMGFPEWDRYDNGHPLDQDNPFQPGDILNPYRQNVLKGDYPILGQHTFLTVTAIEDLLLEARQVPTPTTPFESTGDPNSEEFFGDPDQFLLVNNMVLSFDLIHGDSVFKPANWRLRVTQIFNVNRGIL